MLVAFCLFLNPISSFRASAAACFSAPTNIAGWWPGDGNANDIAGTNNGTLQGGATATGAGIVGSAFTFDGTNGFVQIPNSVSLRPINLTIEAWVRFSGLDSAGSGGSPAGDQYIVFRQNTRSSDFEGFDLSKTRVGTSDVFRFLIASASGQTAEIHSSTTISAGTWYHVAAVRGSNFTQIYVNGVLERGTNVSFAQDYGNFPLYFGTSGQSFWDHKLKGNLDEVSIYSRALSGSEIASIYAAGSAGKCKGPGIAISTIPNQRTFPGTPTRPIPFTVFNAQNPSVTASAQDSTLVTSNNIAITGAGTNFSLTITPGTNIGTTTISVTASNQNGLTATTNFLFSVATFSELVTNLPAAWYGTVNWVDYDNDGYLDLFLSGYDTNFLPHTWLLHNNHDGTFTEVATPFPNWANTSADWADFDNDGYLDLVIKGSNDPWNGYSGAQVFRNLSGTNFVLVANLTAYYNGGSVTWADFDNDGKPDILLSTGNFTLLYHNNGDGTFANIYQLPGGTSSVSDYDNDGWLDILLSGSYPLGTKRYHNTGTNAFTDSGWTLPGFYNSFSAWGDYNNDGWPDLLLSGGSDTGYGTNLLFRNNSGALAYIPAAFAPLRDGAVAWGDFDNDGKLDFFSFGLVIGCCYQSKIYHNAGTNDAFNDFGFSMPGCSTGAAAWGDYDNDGALDLLYMGQVGGNTPLTKLYHNDGAMPDHPPTSPAGLTVTRGRNSALFSWTASTDPDQAGGLTYNVRIGTSNSAIDILSPLSDLATGFRRVPKLGNAGYRTSFLITNLPAGTYYWSVQAIDNAFKGSPFATEQSFNLPAPAITNQPQSFTVLAGSQVVFQVGATGAPPLFFQWSFNGTNLAGASNSTLTLNNVQHADSGAYAVTVSNMWGIIISSNAVLTVNTPPIVLAQPQSVTVIEGQSASFSVSAGGDLPLSYQWLREGAPISGGTNTVLTFDPVVPAQAGNYSVQITNPSGTTNSAVAVLNVPPSVPVIVQHPQSQFVPAGLGVNANFSVKVVGTTPYSYQWRFNATNIPGATGSALTVTNVQTTDAGSYSVLITNSVGPTLSQDAILSTTPAASSTTNFIPFSGATDFIYDDLRDILYIVNGGSDIQRYQIGSASFLTPFSVSGSLATLDLSPDGNLLAVADYTSGANAWIDLVNLNLSTVRQAILTNYPGYVYSLAFGSDAAVVCEVGNLVLRHDPATGITTRRNSVDTSSGPMTASGDRSTIAIAGPGDSAGLVFTYNVGAQGIDGFIWSNDYISSPPEVNRNGSLLAEPTRYGLPIFTNLHTRDYSGNYIALIGGPSGVAFSPNQDLLFCGRSGTRELHAYETASFTESFVLDFGAAVTSSRMRTSGDGSKIFGAVSGGINWITWTNIGPAFATQPVSQTIFAGSNVTFTARVFGSPLMKYQWQRDGVSLFGATNASLTLSGFPYGTLPSAYSVIAYNPYGVLVSTNATLTIVSAPFITAQPQSQSIGAGSNVIFTVTADGSPSLSYQWRANGTNVPGASGTAITATNVQVSTPFAVVINNSYGATTSSVATLTVVPNPPQILTQPQSQSTFVGTNVLLTVAALGSEPLSYSWFTNGINLTNGGRISGATSTALSIANAQVTDSGGYYAVVTNLYGMATSAMAALSVTGIPPAITRDPVGGAVAPGLLVTFSASASGTAPLSYQWQLNGTDVPGATNTVLTISNVVTTNFGTYRLGVSSPYGSVASAGAVVVPGNVASWNTFSSSLVPLAATNITMLSAGNNGSALSHILALRPDGIVVAWGNNSFGQTNVPASATNIVAVAAGGTHSLALRADGTLIGWGNNTSGQLNLPSTLSNVVAIAAGGSHSAALRSDGRVFAWGLNSEGQTTVPGNLGKVVAIAAGNAHTLALRSDGVLVAWGRSRDEKQLSPGPGSVPAGLGSISTMAGGSYHNAAVRTNGTVLAWGSITAAFTNVPVSATNVLAVAANDSYSMALRSDGLVVAWGNMQSFNPPTTVTNVPAAVSNAVGIAASTQQGLALLGNGRPLITRQPVGGTSFVGRSFAFSATATGTGPLSYQWQSNGVDIANATNSSLTFSNLSLAHSATYQLTVHSPPGIPAAVASSVPVPLTVLDNPNLAFLTPLPGLQTNYQGARLPLNASVTGNGPVTYRWSFNGTNLPGATNEDLIFDPVLVTNGGNYSVTASNLTMGISSITSTQRVVLVKAWGYQSNEPPVTLTNAIALAVGFIGEGLTAGHYLALRSDGKIVPWGSNEYGQTNLPASVTNAFITGIAAGFGDGLALRSDGTVAAWGYNAYGVTNAPASATNVIAVSCGDYHDLALRGDGTVVAWGLSSDNRLNVPVSATNVVAISGGGSHSLALRANGTVVAWGQNASGQLNVPASATNVIAVAAGASQSLALRADGTVVQWGSTAAPQPPAGLSNIVAIAAGYYHNTALRNDGVPITWGSYYSGSASVPVDVVNVVQISTRADHDVGMFGTRAPAVTVQPFDRLVFQGSNTTFVAKFAGVQPVAYQWQSNGTNIPGATTDTLALTNVQPPQAGNYQLIASNSYGVTASRVAKLSLPDPPVITLQPLGQTTNAGATVQFRVTATGFAPLTYQWRKNQTNNLGTNGSVLALNNVTRSNNGLYSVFISNIAGTATSSNALLKVIVPQRFSSGALIANGSVLFFSGDSDGGALTTNDLSAFTAQASSNLADWINLPNALSITNSLLMLQDANQSNYPARFYRIVEQ